MVQRGVWVFGLACDLVAYLRTSFCLFGGEGGGGLTFDSARFRHHFLGDGFTLMMPLVLAWLEILESSKGLLRHHV